MVAGEWPAPPGIPLHLEFHKARHDVKVALHNHPTYGTLWSDAHAWQILSATGGVPSAVPDWFIEQTRRHDGTGFHGFWEQAVRAELDADPSLGPA